MTLDDMTVKVHQLRDRGLSHGDIAAALGITRSKAQRLASRVVPVKAEASNDIAIQPGTTPLALSPQDKVQQFIDNKSKVLETMQCGIAGVIQEITDGFDAATIADLPPDKRARVTRDLSTSLAILFDKCRLHEGKSTSNALILDIAKAGAMSRIESRWSGRSDISQGVK